MSANQRKKRLNKKEQYNYMTRLGWDATYKTEEELYPYLNMEGIKIHDWNAWEDPFRMTMESYWNLQAEKDKKLYSIIDAFAQNNGQKNITDARYVNALKIFLTAVTPLEHKVVSGFANVARSFKGEGATIACQMQAIDELRHYQTQVHTISHYNKYFDGFSEARTLHDRVWYLSVPKSFGDDASTAGPFEFMVSIGFSFEFVLTSLLFVPFMSGAAYNGDMATVTFGFSAQSDESRHMTLGLQAVKFMLEQDSHNVPIVQEWMDKWLWRGYRLLAIVSAMMDYMLPNSPTSWSEAVSLYIEQNAVALYKDLERYGIKTPTKMLEKIKVEKEHYSHLVWKTLYVHTNATAFHTWLPSEEKMNWLSEKYPNTFDKYYRPIFEFYKKKADAGERYYSQTLPCLCQTCQLPLLFTDVMNDNATVFTHATSEFNGEKFHFCSDECKDVFEREPKKYVQSWLPPHQIFQGNCGGATIPEVLQWYKIEQGADNMDYVGSPDEVMWNKLKNFKG
jgi:phenol hydroxylase P3 protein